MTYPWHDEPTEIKLDSHATRHEDGGADEISIKGLSGEPAVIDAIQTYYGVVQTHESNIQTWGA